MSSSMNSSRWEDCKNLTVKGRGERDFFVVKRSRPKAGDFAYGYSTPEGVYVESFDDAKLVPTNELEAKRFVVAKNHRYNKAKRVAQIHLEYLRSLERFNKCMSCELPIRSKRAFLSNKEVWEVYSEIPEHYEVRQRADNPKKWEYIRVPAHRVFNVRCQCHRRGERKIEKARERE